MMIENQPVEELRGPDHLCLFYTSSAEQLAAVIPFVRTGLKRGERCIYIADENPGATIEAFQAAGISVEDAIRVGALVVLTKWDTYLRGGNFDPQTMLQYLQQLIHILPINIVLRKSQSTTDSIPCVHRACPSSGSMSSMTNPTMSCGARMADRWRCRSG
jgi:hypothetical protein